MRNLPAQSTSTVRLGTDTVTDCHYRLYTRLSCLRRSRHIASSVRRTNSRTNRDVYRCLHRYSSLLLLVEPTIQLYIKQKMQFITMSMATTDGFVYSADAEADACNVAGVSCNVARVSCKVGRVSCNVARVSCNVARVSCNIRPTGNTCNITRNTCNITRVRLRVRVRRIHKAQQTTYNTACT